MPPAAGFRQFDNARAEETVHAVGACEHPHRHDDAYAAIVLDGAYEEASADGAVAVACGDIVVHPPFHAHRNRFPQYGAVVLNVVLPARRSAALGYRIIRSPVARELAGLARRNAAAAAMGVLEEASVFGASSQNTTWSCGDWLDAAAEQLRTDPTLEANAVARKAGRTAEHLSRVFSARFGVGPAAFRAEHRFRKAFDAMLAGARPAGAAAIAGYADQAHFTRECKRIAGTSPAALLREIKSVQDTAAIPQ